MTTVTRPWAMALPARRALTRRHLGIGLRLSLLGLSAFLVLFPFLWVLAASLKPPVELNRPSLWGFAPTAANWAEVWLGSPFPRYFLNSIVVGVLTVGISLLVGAPAAYAFSRFRTGGTWLRFLILAAQMLPPALFIIPFFLMAYYTGLLDTVWAVAAAHLTFIAPLVTWFLIGFFEDVPRDLEEQAMVDGCTRWQAFLRVVLPAARPGLGAAGLFAFIMSWNEMFYALMLAGGHSKTLPVAIAGYWTFRGVELGKMSVAILSAALPVLVASFFVQRFLIRGLGGGAIKG
ncbi:carbohydrate ABC transporter membrane protein 2, CUT1 family [Thermoflexus hugenholtzii JAD2]|uniref:Carbohydrate ABC transporter membrane protein 2, CUT1 family n=2 Tax=Thermoflexus TaxID=1495649 RepID=A0A212PWJ9_9CHLR|nr:carbohydrate ABC transporter permease [Thermoflexus hugenholtzii]SNB51331.1 carbohydrate ABC transporter membrane protein 2, CUT1 family [Thermoflexus hugenholtzii JAD2]